MQKTLMHRLIDKKNSKCFEIIETISADFQNSIKSRIFHGNNLTKNIKEYIYKEISKYCYFNKNENIIRQSIFACKQFWKVDILDKKQKIPTYLNTENNRSL